MSPHHLIVTVNNLTIPDESNRGGVCGRPRAAFSQWSTDDTFAVEEGATANYFFFNASTIRLRIFCLPGLGAVLAYPDPTVSLVLHCLQLMRPFLFSLLLWLYARG
jgi:hypothetical protein